MFFFSSEYDRAIQNYTRFDDWYLWVQMHKGTVSMPVFQSLEAFWPGLQVQSTQYSDQCVNAHTMFLKTPVFLHVYFLCVCFSLSWGTWTAQ